MRKFDAQMTVYLKTERSEDGKQRFGGVVLQVKGKIPKEAMPIINELNKLAQANGKLFEDKVI